MNAHRGPTPHGPPAVFWIAFRERQPADLLSANGSKAKNAFSSSSLDELNTYLEQLKDIRALWRKAAKLTYDDKIEEARKLLRSELLVSSGNKWHSLNKSLDRRLDPVLRHRNMTYRFEFPIVFLIMESPELGVKYLEAKQKEEKLDFQWSNYLSQSLIEALHYSKAREVLLGLIEDGMGSSRKRILESRLEAIENLEDGRKPPVEFYQKVYVETSLKWYDGRIGPILSVWEHGSDNRNLEILAALFARAGDDHGERLTLRLIAGQAGKSGDRKEAADALVRIANKAYQHKTYGVALRIWRQIEEDYESTPAWAKAVFNIGAILKEQRRFDEAIEMFKKLLAHTVANTEPGAHIMEAYRNYHARAQWETGNCLLAKSNYAAALEAYERTEKNHPFRSWCGTCQGAYECQYALYQGLCLEYLGEHEGAVKKYFKVDNETHAILQSDYPDSPCRLVPKRRTNL